MFRTIIQFAILFTILKMGLTFTSDMQELEKTLIRLDVTTYYIADTATRVRHYVVPHTEATMYCPECGLLEKLEKKELKE